MKKLLALMLTAVLVLSAAFAAVIPVSADETYSVSVTEMTGLTTDTTTSTDAPVLFAGGSLAQDAAVSSTFSCYLKVTTGSDAAVRRYTLIVDGEEHASWITATYNAGNNTCNLFINLPEGTYSEIIARGTDDNGVSMDIVKFTDITVTEAENSVPDDKEVESTPCWRLDAADMANGAGSRMSITDSGEGYATFASTESGDPNVYYVKGATTKVGRWLLIKYNNHSIIPRMQIYISQEAGISSDNNMIEFPIAANGSGWTYVIVDMSKNQFYDNDTQSVYNFRFDPLEARNWSGGSYQFSGNESIDIAYIAGFTTQAGLMSYLEENELHDVTKTAVLQESQVTFDGDAATYTDEEGVEWDVTKNEDGTYSYTFEKKDVRTPCDATPKLLIDGSTLAKAGHNVTTEMDSTTGVTTVTVTGDDPYVMLFSGVRIGARYLAVRYRTTVEDKMEFFLSSTEAGPVAGSSFRRKVKADNQWHTEVYDLTTVGIATLNTDTYELSYLRLDYLVKASSGTIDFEYVAFFDSEDAAYQYVHEYKTYTATFMASGQVVDRVVFEAGTVFIDEPEVPEKEGYKGKWKTYSLRDANIIITAEYTLIEQPTTEAPTETEEPTQTEAPETESATEAATTAVEDESVTEAPDTDTEPQSETTAKAEEVTTAGEKTGGCKSVLSGFAVLLLAAGAAVTLTKRKH